MIEEPAIIPIGTPEAALHGERLMRCEARDLGVEAMFKVFSVHAFYPAVSQFLLQRAPGEVKPGLIKESAEHVRA